MIMSLLLATGSCNVLNQDPYSSIADSGAIKDKYSVEGAINGMYSALQSTDYYGGEFVFMNSLLGDESAHTGSFPTNAQFYVNQVLPNNVTMSNIYGAIYNVVYKANVIITRTPALAEKGITADEKAQFVAQAKFVRALCFFDLARLWGNVPLPVDDDVFKSAKLAQTPQAQVYAKVIEDLEAIQNILPVSYSAPKGSAVSDEQCTKAQATSAAVKALLARVYLYTKQYSKAAITAKEVLSMGFSLDNDYGNLFIPGGTLSKEHIFNVYYDTNDKNTLAFYFFPAPEGRRELGPSSDLLSALLNEDARRINVIKKTGGITYGYKYKDAGTGTDQPTILRAAEMVLIRAEALAMSAAIPPSEAIDLLNSVRVRSGLKTISPRSQEEFMNELLAERMREFCFEPHRFTDLTRTGKADEVLSFVKGEDAWQTTDALLPIPASEIIRNPALVQNPGY